MRGDGFVILLVNPSAEFSRDQALSLAAHLLVLADPEDTEHREFVDLVERIEGAD